MSAGGAGKQIQGYLLYLQKKNVDLSNQGEKQRNQHYLKDVFRMAGMPRGYLDQVGLPRFQVKTEPGTGTPTGTSTESKGAGTDPDASSSSSSSSSSSQYPPPPPPPPPTAVKIFEKKAEEMCCMVLKGVAPDAMESAIFNTELKYPDDLKKLWELVFSFFQVSTRNTRQQKKSEFYARRKQPNESYMMFREELLKERNSLNAVLTRKKLDDIEYLDQLLYCLEIDDSGFTHVIEQMVKDNNIIVEEERRWI